MELEQCAFSLPTPKHPLLSLSLPSWLIHLFFTPPPLLALGAFALPTSESQRKEAEL